MQSNAAEISQILQQEINFHELLQFRRGRHDFKGGGDCRAAVCKLSRRFTAFPAAGGVQFRDRGICQILLIHYPGVVLGHLQGLRRDRDGLGFRTMSSRIRMSGRFMKSPTQSSTKWPGRGWTKTQD